MILLKNTLVLKLAIGALGLIVGIGGVTAGAKYRQAHPMQNQAIQRTFIGAITAVGPRGFTLHTRSGKDVTIAVFPHTTVAHRGRIVPRADLRVGDVVLVQCLGESNGVFNAFHIRIPILANPSAQGP
jgi:hypothetical protein